jgi:hypothetical protein
MTASFFLLQKLVTRQLILSEKSPCYSKHFVINYEATLIIANQHFALFDLNIISSSHYFFLDLFLIQNYTPQRMIENRRVREFLLGRDESVVL